MRRHWEPTSSLRFLLLDVYISFSLVAALKSCDWNIEKGLESFQINRKPVLEKMTEAALRSGQWYESFDQHMKLEPLEFAYSYITRAGRIDPQRLATASPKFFSELQKAKIEF